MYCTTLNRIRAHGPCESGWRKLLKHLGDIDRDALFPIETILDSNGLDDTLWALRSCPEFDRLHRHFAVWCARQVQHLMTDKRSLDALDVAERHADGLATDEELAAAWDVAWTAAWDVAGAARDAAEAAARAAAWVAWDAAWDAAEAAARDAAGEKQIAMLRRIFNAPSLEDAVNILKRDKGV